MNLHRYGKIVNIQIGMVTLRFPSHKTHFALHIASWNLFRSELRVRQSGQSRTAILNSSGIIRRDALFQSASPKTVCCTTLASSGQIGQTERSHFLEIYRKRFRN